jgi:hypothetical protein
MHQVLIIEMYIGIKKCTANTLHVLVQHQHQLKAKSYSVLNEPQIVF